jgi:integrase
VANGKRHGLFKRDGGIYAFRYKDGDRWKEKSTGETNFEEARQRKETFERAIKDGTLPTAKSGWTVEQAATRWVEQHAARLTAPKARKNERSYLNQLVRRLGTLKLKNVSLDVLKDYQARRSAEVAPRPVNLELQILVSVLKEANLWRPLAEHFRRLKEPTSKVGKALKPEQLRHLHAIAASRDDWMVAYNAALLASNCGIRGGEIKALRLGAIDLERRRLCVIYGKTAAAGRMVELNAAATAAVTSLYMRAQALGGRDAEHFLLPGDLSRHTRSNDPLKGGVGYDPTKHQTAWDTAWRNLRRAAASAITERAEREQRELTDEEWEWVKMFQTLRFHNLRHSFITAMAERNVPLPVVMAMVGHMSPEMTRHYTHISDNASRRAVELLGNLWGKSMRELFRLATRVISC